MQHVIDDKIIAAVNAAAGCDVTGTIGCEVLAMAMEESGHGRISVSTLKRLFMKNISEKVKHPRRSTLDSIARHCGYAGYAEMWSATHNPEEFSGFDATDYLESAELRAGDCLRLEYEPRRVLRLKYLGEDWFEVVAELGSNNIMPGDHLRISSFSVNNSLVAGDVVRNGVSLGRYEAARQGGLKLIEPE